MQKTGTLFTIGYGNKTHTEIFAWLQKSNVQVLVDVRTKPYSRFRPDFNRSRLEVSLPAIGIRYEFKGVELGGLSQREETLYRRGIDFLLEGLELGHTVAIICCESDVRNCHRLDIAEDIFRRGYTVIHFGKQGEPIAHEGLLF